MCSPRLAVWVWVHFSLHKFKESSIVPQPAVLPPPKWGLSANTKMTSGVILYVLAGFSRISVVGTVAFQVEGCQRPLVSTEWLVGRALPGGGSRCVVHGGGGSSSRQGGKERAVCLFYCPRVHLHTVEFSLAQF